MTTEPGAIPANDFIPLCVPEIGGNEWTYIKECLDTNWVSSVGPYVDSFEKSLAEFLEAKYAIATSSGTAALHIALLVAGVEANDEVIISDLTFIAPANTIRYVGAYPIFIDVEPVYWQMDPQKLADFLENGCRRENGGLYNRRTGRRVRAIMPVHILGHPCDMDEILKLARQYELIIIEDATESLGAKYKGQMVGHIGDIGCLSFNGNKLITTGGGGMIVTDNEQWARRAKYLTTQAKDDPIEFIHNTVGYNYRLSNIQAAMGCAQMERIGQYIDKKRRIADAYRAGFENVPGIRTMQEASYAFSTYWMYTILVDESQFGMDSRVLLRKLNGAHIQTRPLWQPMHLSPVFQEFHPESCAVSARVNQMALSLPSSVGLTSEQQQTVIKTVMKFAGSS